MPNRAPSVRTGLEWSELKKKMIAQSSFRTIKIGVGIGGWL